MPTLKIEVTEETAELIQALVSKSKSADMAEVFKKAMALYDVLLDHDEKGGGVMVSRSIEEGCGLERLTLVPRNFPTIQPARSLGWSCSQWGGKEGVDHMEIHWPEKKPEQSYLNTLQLTLGPDGGELYGFIKIEQTAVNHWLIKPWKA